MAEAILAVERLSKKYRLGQPRPSFSLREDLSRLAIGLWRRWRAPGSVSHGSFAAGEYLWALREVSFAVHAGEAVGIIGRNGAGKSTLLKILSRVTAPSAGRAVLRGRVGSLLEVGTGFHGQLTGRENIYLSGAILGLRKAEIDRRFDAIAAFAGVERFLDTPIKYYSSGMQVRLGFAIAAHLEPEILLLDEALAVGDAAFQRKCLAKMGEVAQAGRTVLFVSHDLTAIQHLCQRVLVLEEGRVCYDGEATAGIAAYLQLLRDRQPPAGGDLRQRCDRRGNGRLRFTAISLRDHAGQETDRFCAGQAAEFAVSYQAESQLRGVRISLCVQSDLGQDVFTCDSQVLGLDWDNLPLAGVIHIRLPRFPLARGLYQANLYAEVSGEVADWIVAACCFEAAGGDFYGTGRLPPPGHSPWLVEQTWQLEALAVAEAEGKNAPA
ncbi:MAG: ABC transporter ATP-binding protein [Planctomycetota bacterium]|nr:ABC transporter ATP-binding protein [Planctomycetota bacterium]